VARIVILRRNRQNFWDAWVKTFYEVRRQNYMISFQHFLYYIKNTQTINPINNNTTMQLAGFFYWKCHKTISFASERMQGAERVDNFVVDSSLQSSNKSKDFNRRRGVAMSITVSISAVSCTGRWRRCDHATSNIRRSPSLIPKASIQVKIWCPHSPALAAPSLPSPSLFPFLSSLPFPSPPYDPLNPLDNVVK